MNLHSGFAPCMSAWMSYKFIWWIQGTICHWINKTPLGNHKSHRVKFPRLIWKEEGETSKENVVEKFKQASCASQTKCNRNLLVFGITKLGQHNRPWKKLTVHPQSSNNIPNLSTLTLLQILISLHIKIKRTILTQNGCVWCFKSAPR